jgi:hypothetical protein
MTLSKYDNELLEFMYLLTKKQSYMNPSEIARYLSSQDRRVTDRTVRRWFGYLRKYHFDYFPYPRYAAMDLVPVWVLTDLNEKVLEAVPHKAAIVSGVDFQSFEKRLLCLYLVPADRLRDFKKLWSIALNRGVLKYCRVFEAGIAFAFYSPFHRLIDEDGLVAFPKDHDVDNSYFTGLMRKSLESGSRTKLNGRIIKNPLIVPIIWECFRRNKSSHRIWSSFERKMGDRVWDYINVPRTRREKKRGAGIRHVQATIRNLQSDFHDFFQQTRVVYYPFYTHENNMFYMFLKLKRREDMIPFSELLSRHALSIVVYTPLGAKSKVMAYYILTNKRETLNIISDLIQPYIDKSFDNKIIYEDFEKTAKYRNPELRYWKRHYMRAVYHKLFDPVTCKWKFDAKAYARKLR